jgi:hypothetical protein
MMVLTLGALTLTAQPAPAGVFSKQSKINPAERVPALISTLRADAEERKRSSAAEELRHYDPSMFPEIIPSLVEAAQHDPKSGVRMDAITSLAKLRPVSQQAGAAIEQATHDDSVRVRLQARTLLWQYHLAGYHGAKTPEIGQPKTPIYTQEPPLATQATQPQSPPISVIQNPVAPQSTVGYVSPGAEPMPQPNVWGATNSPRTLPAQPAALPIGPKSVPPTQIQERAAATPQPLPPAPASERPSAPQPLPAGPSKPADKGPKPLPEGPADIIGKPTVDKPIQESPKAPQKDEGPELP